MVMNVNSKIICFGIGFLMSVQNYIYFLTYWDLYVKIGLDDAACAGTSWWLGYDAVVCAIETAFALGMMIGALWDGSLVLWWVFFVLHLIDAVPGYTVATIFLYKEVISEDGVACREANPFGQSAYVASSTQVYFGYVFYVFFMCALIYMVVLKKDDEDGTFLEPSDNDKVIIGSNGIMMMIQNFMFAQAFWTLFILMSDKECCARTKWWLGYDAIVCAVETVFAGGMALGGLVDGSKVLWWIFFVLHLIDAVPGYTVATVWLGRSVNSENYLCNIESPNIAPKTFEVWRVQAIFYAFYCCNMVAQIYMVVIKEKKDRHQSY
jgi:hypothetical protein